MKLAAKLVSIIILGIIIILAVDGYVTIRRDTEILEANMKRDSQLMGRSLRDLIADVWEKRGQERVLELIKHADKEEYLINIRWVNLNAPPDDQYSPHINREKLGMVIQGEDISFKEQLKGGAGYLYTYVPIKVGEKKFGALELSQSLSGLHEHTHRAVYRIFVLMLILLFLSVIAVFLLGFGMIGRPLNSLVEKIRRIGEGDLSEPLNIRGRSEFSELATALNTMCKQLNDAQENVRKETSARIAAIEQLRHADRLKTVGGLSSGIAHELGTPLNVVSGRAGLIATGDLSETEVVESATIIKKQSERMAAIIRDLLNFARRHSPKKTIVDLRQIILQTINLMAPLSQKQKAKLCFAGEDIAAMVMVDAGQIQQVLTNLIVNALQAMPQGGNIEVGIRPENIHHPEGGKDFGKEYLCVYVRDEGVGIQEKNIQHIFEPFFTTKDTGKGTGLGLSIAYDIIQEHGGWIEVRSTPGAGSCFSFYLPWEVEA
jgi:signal transduction histidine kinase